jgi:hypothetical protein
LQADPERLRRELQRGACAMNCSTKPYSSVPTTPGQDCDVGWRLNGDRPHWSLKQLTRRPSLPHSPQRAIGCATPASSADRHSSTSATRRTKCRASICHRIKGSVAGKERSGTAPDPEKLVGPRNGSCSGIAATMASPLSSPHAPWTTPFQTTVPST